MKPGLKIGLAIALALLVLGAEAQNIVDDAPKWSGYHVFGAEAVYAGSTVPHDKSKGGLVPLYVGQYLVWGSGVRGEYAHDTYSASRRSAPQGAVLALWSAYEASDERAFDEEWGAELPVLINKRYYYVAARPEELIPYPPKSRGHQYYGIYVSVGGVVVSDAGLRLEDAAQARHYSEGRRNPVSRHAFGREDTLYYKLLSRNAQSPSILDDTSVWHTLPGVAITEAQYMEMSLCSPVDFQHANGGNCRVFLSEGDPDLTPEQRAYVRQHPVTREDIKALIAWKTKIYRRGRRWQ